MTGKAPTFAKLAPIVVHAPGLFRSPEKGDRDKYVRITHQHAGLEFEIAGPVLGVAELRVLQAIAAIAGPAYGMRSTSGTGIDRLAVLLAQSEPLETSYTAVAKAAGYAGGSSSRAAVRGALKLLGGVTVSVTAGTRGLALGHLIQHSLGKENDCLTVHLSPVLVAAILGGPGSYLRVSLEEARQLKSDPARLLHHRLHWVNPGETRNVGMESLLRYVYPDAVASSSTLRTRRAVVRRAVDELGKAGWTVIRTGFDSYSVKRPAPAKSQTPPRPDRRRLVAGMQTLSAPS